MKDRKKLEKKLKKTVKQEERVANMLTRLPFVDKVLVTKNLHDRTTIWFNDNENNLHIYGEDKVDFFKIIDIIIKYRVERAAQKEFERGELEGRLEMREDMLDKFCLVLDEVKGTIKKLK